MLCFRALQNIRVLYLLHLYVHFKYIVLYHIVHMYHHHVLKVAYVKCRSRFNSKMWFATQIAVPYHHRYVYTSKHTCSAMSISFSCGFNIRISQLKSMYMYILDVRKMLSKMLIFYSCITKGEFSEIPKVEITMKLMPNTMHASPDPKSVNIFRLVVVMVAAAVCATWKFRFVKVNQSDLVNCHRFSESLAPKVESGGNYILNKQRDACKLITNPKSHCLLPCQSKFFGIRATVSGCHTFFSKSKHFVDCLKTFERSILPDSLALSLPFSVSRAAASFIVFHFCLLNLKKRPKICFQSKCTIPFFSF